MKLINYNIDFQFNYTKSSIYSLVIENPKEYYGLTKQIISQCEGGEGGWILSDVLPIDINKNALVLYDFYHIDCNNKKMDNLLKNEIIKISSNIDFCEIVTNFNKNLIEFNELVISNLPFSIMANNEISVEELIKFSKFTFQEPETLLEQIVNYIDTYSKLSHIKVVIFVGVVNILTQEEISQLIKEVTYYDIKMLFIDTVKSKVFNEKEQVIIDNDLCLI